MSAGRPASKTMETLLGSPKALRDVFESQSDLVKQAAAVLKGKRRVFLARALSQEASVWLLDEPTAGLDPRHRLQFLQTLLRVRRERGTTVLFVTHDIDLAAELGDRVLLLARGRALAEGTPAEVLTPAHLREAFGVSFERRGGSFVAFLPGPDPQG